MRVQNHFYSPRQLFGVLLRKLQIFIFVVGRFVSPLRIQCSMINTASLQQSCRYRGAPKSKTTFMAKLEQSCEQKSKSRGHAHKGTSQHSCAGSSGLGGLALSKYNMRTFGRLRLHTAAIPACQVSGEHGAWSAKEIRKSFQASEAS